MMDMDDGEMGPEEAAMHALMEMLEDKGGELMKEKHGPKDEPKGAVHGHVVQVTVTPHHPGDGHPERDEPDGDESGLTQDMLEHLLGGDEEDEDDGEK
jgi:hypothetical protein